MANNPFSRRPASPVEAQMEELEAHRTVGLTRMAPAEPVDETLPTEDGAPSESVTRYEVNVGSMSNSFDGGQGIVEGDVELTEYVNDEYVSKVTVTSSVIVETDTPLNLIEDRLLNSARETLKRLAELSDEDLRDCLDSSRKDQAYRQ